MFQGFTPETGDFLWGLAVNNSRGWFNEHRDTYERALNQPFRALGAEVLARLQARRPDFDYQLHIARIYRDARRLYGRGPFKENLWFTISRGDPHEGGPTYWFELNGREWSYGAGSWDSTADEAAVWRRAIDADPSGFEAIVDGIAAHGDYKLWGDPYKRPKADLGAKLNPWYNRRHVTVGWEHPFGGALYTEALPDLLDQGFELLTPFYEFRRAAFLEARSERAAQRARSIGASQDDWEV